MIAFLNGLVLVVGALPPTAAAHAIETLNVPSEIYWLAADASGARLCDQGLKKEQGKAFDARFGPVVLAAVKAMEADRHVSKSELIVTSSCRAFVNIDAAHEQLSRALDDFDPVIRRIQLRYKIGCWEIFCGSHFDKPPPGR
ncbi:hypothetical protein [Sphingomonas sp. HMP6]|uniref:hypothetical protein n=1 Tax=Sphingomonas sp. HMP6 TaxID=1517551 RepID=UPI0015966E4C|nr:hypothetical protein [Sphingomonas sp. HMP6]BCA57873.1 hypothetical protein HMP06_0642 [Sphingomonas sp. HMP6]